MQLGKLEIHIDEKPEQVSYTFKGEVDEYFDPESIPHLKKKQICFHLAGIEAFNSCGIREWIAFVRKIGKIGELLFCGCSIPMMDQINMIPQSLGKGLIKSFYAPYYCRRCGETSQLIEVNAHLSLLKQKQAPPFNCESCNENLDFDTLEASYFLFMDYIERLHNAS